MHNCEQYRIPISALIDNEISDTERNEVLAHVAECSDCKAYLDDQMLLHETVQSLDCTVPAGFADSIMARVRETKQEHPQRKVISFPRWKQFASLAACCAVIILGIFVTDSGILTMDSTSNCAAPETALMTTGITQTSDNCAAVADGEAAELPQTAAKSAPESPSEGDNGACLADAAGTPAVYAAGSQFAAQLTTDSTLAAEWVKDTLGQDWISGTRYRLTLEEYTALLELLTNAGVQFDETYGTEGSDLYQLLAR